MDNFRMVDVYKNAEMLIRKCVAAKEGEKVLIVADTASEFLIVNALAAAAHTAGAAPAIIVVPNLDYRGAAAMIHGAAEAANIVFTATTRSIINSPVFSRLLFQEKKFRLCSLVGTQLSGFTTGGATIDPDELYRTTEAVSKAIAKGKILRFSSELGTDLTGIIDGMPCRIAGGIARNPGDLATFPDGEAFQGPREGTAEGVVVVDMNMTSIGPLSEPIKYVVKQGKLVSIEGGKEAAKLRQLIDGVENADNIAEMSVGTNTKARFNGEQLNDKHVAGSVHVALGNNLMYGGKTSCSLHLDGVISNATVEVDGKVIVERGRIRV